MVRQLSSYQHFSLSQPSLNPRRTKTAGYSIGYRSGHRGSIINDFAEKCFVLHLGASRLSLRPGTSPAMKPSRYSEPSKSKGTPFIKS